MANQKKETARTTAQKEAFDAYMERTTPAMDIHAELEAKHKAEARKGIFKAEHDHVSVNGQEIEEGPETLDEALDETLDVDDAETLDPREAEANKANKFLWPLGTRVKFKLSGTPEEVNEAPSIYDATRIVPHHWDFPLKDATGQEFTLSIYDSQTPGFKKGINRRTGGDLLQKFPRKGYDQFGHEAPENIPLCGKWGKATPDERAKAIKAMTAKWTEDTSPEQKRKDTSRLLGGIALYLLLYPVEFEYNYKQKPDGTLTDKPGLCWCYPEDRYDRPTHKTWIKF